MAEHLRAVRRLALALLLQLGDQQVQLLDQGVDQVAAPGMVLTGHLHIVTHLTGFLMNLRALEMLILLQGLRNSSSSAVNSLSLWSRSCSFDFTLGLNPVNKKARTKSQHPLKTLTLTRCVECTKDITWG